MIPFGRSQGNHTRIAAAILAVVLAAAAPTARGEPTPNARAGALRQEIELGRADQVQRLLDAGADPNGIDPPWTVPPLRRAVQKGDPRIVAALLDAGARRDEDYVGQGTALDLAITLRWRTVVGVLIEHGAICRNPRFQPAKDLTLLLAVRRGDMEGMRAYLAKKPATIDVNARDYAGDTALLIAVADRREGFVMELLAAGADPNLCASDGRSAIQIAGEQYSYGIVKALSAAGATDKILMTPEVLPSRSNSSAAEIEKILAGRGQEVESWDPSLPKPPSPLAEAAARGDLEQVLRLLDAHSPLEDHGRYGRTALLAAAAGGHTEIALRLILAQADPNAVDNSSETALQYACSSGDVELCQALIRSGARMNAVNGVGRTPLVTAIAAHRWDAAQSLLDAGADVNATGPTGETALMRSVTEDAGDFVRALLAQGAKVNAANASGVTSLMVAADRGRLELARELIARGAEVNAATAFQMDGRRWTPLWYAVLRGHPDLARMLRDAGAR